MRLFRRIAASLAVAGSREAHANGQKLVPLQRQGPSHMTWKGIPVHHAGATVSGYVDRRYPTPWVVSIRYAGCPATRQGAFRLTVYARSPENLGFQAVLSPEYQYSRTLVDDNGSDDATYEFIAQPATWYYYRVVIPARSGCVWWQLVARTN